MMRIPAWICETHLQEIDNLETSGELQEARETLALAMAEYLWCADCTALKNETVA
jgi:hypothetical protein